MTTTTAMPVIEHKSLVGGFTKVLTDEGDGIVTAVVSVTGIVDEVKDVIVPGAYAKTLAVRIPKGVDAHEWSSPVSKPLWIKELMPGDPGLPKKTARGEPWPREAGALMVKALFNLKTQRGRDAYEDVRFFEDEQEWCVDEDTEILTDRGWLRWNEVTTDDKAYTLNPETVTGRFEEIKAVNVFDAKPRRMRKIEVGGFSSLTTAAHRWPVRFNDGRPGWRTTETLAVSNGIFRSAVHAELPVEPKWSDAFVEIVAWYWTEGWQSGLGADIGQSVEKNPHHVGAIRAALDAAFPGQWSENPAADGMVRFHIASSAASGLFAVLGPDKQPRPDFLLSLTGAQLRLLIERCMDGDGHTTSTGQRTWYQVSDLGVRAFEMACVLAGIPTATHQPKDYGNRFGRVPQNVALLRSSVAKPLDAIRVKGLNDKPERTPAVDEWVGYDGHVWCPTTPSGTWLARRNGSVYFTGNSIGYNVPTGGARIDHKKGIRFIDTLDLFEYSTVLFGAMPLAGTHSVKRYGGMLVGAATQEIKAVPGSYEHRSSMLEDAALEALRTGDDGFVSVRATFDEKVIVTHYQKGESQVYEIPYTISGDDVTLGTPVPVKITETVELDATPDPETAEPPAEDDMEHKEAETAYLSPSELAATADLRRFTE